jgi:hypothetical protein
LGGYEEIDENKLDELPEIVKIITPDGNLQTNTIESAPNDEIKVVTVVIETPRKLNVASQHLVREIKAQ